MCISTNVYVLAPCMSDSKLRHSYRSLRQVLNLQVEMFKTIESTSYVAS